MGGDREGGGREGSHHLQQCLILTAVPVHTCNCIHCMVGKSY